MKRRRGFVSNSSSSSFVVVFPHKPGSVEEVKMFMFPGMDWDDIISEFDYSTTVSAVVTQVWNDLDGQRCLSVAKVADELSSGWEEFLCFATEKERDEYAAFEAEKKKKDDEYWRNYHALRARAGMEPGDPEPKKRPAGEKGKALDEYKAFQKARQDGWHDSWEKQDALRNKFARRSATRFMKEQKGKWIGRFSYEDKGEFFTLMEHANVFRNLEHIRISHH